LWGPIVTPFPFNVQESHQPTPYQGFVSVADRRIAGSPDRRAADLTFSEISMTIEQIIDFATAAPAAEHYLPAAKKIISGNPQQSVRSVYASPCSQFQAGTWKGEPGVWKVHYTEHEYCEILAGRSVITDQHGNRKELAQGDRFVIPAGFNGTWEVLETCEKVYVIFEASNN
jgi:uncharacterized cupin superfamily protein